MKVLLKILCDANQFEIILDAKEEKFLLEILLDSNQFGIILDAKKRKFY